MATFNNDSNETLLRAKEAYFACDFKKAFSLFEEAAKAGNAEAQCRLGEFYDDFGRGFPVDYKKARELYEQSWAQGYPRAAAQLSTIYEDAREVERDKKKAKALLDKSVKLGDSFGKWLRACELLGKDKLDEAKKLSDEILKDPEFVRETGRILEYMLDFAKESNELLSRAENEDISEKFEAIREKMLKKVEKEISGADFPCKYLGEFLLASFLEDEDDEVAEKYYQRAAESGVNVVIASYAYFLELNEKPGAAELALKAVENIRDEKAMLTLGKCYLLGEEVDRDEEKAEYWLKEMLETVDTEDDKDLVAEAYLWLGKLEDNLRDNQEKALKYYKKAAEQEAGIDSILACGKVAEIYYSAEAPEAFEWAKKGAEQDEATSLRVLSLCYREGVGTEKNLAKHLEIAQKLFDMESPDGAELLAIANLNGLGVPEDEAKAIEYYKKADELGSTSAAGAIAFILYGKDDPEAFKWAQKGAEKEDPRALNILALCYREGIGVEANAEEHVSIAKKLFEKEDYRGAELLAIAYRDGLGVPEDTKKAIEYYKKAHELGSSFAAGSIAQILYRENNPEAFEWAKKGAERKDADALFYLSLCYREGVGTKEDLDKHIEHALELLDLGDPQGAMLLAVAYRDGLGVPENEDKAIEYYKKGDELGHIHAAGEIARILYGRKDPKAFEWAKKGAEHDEPDALQILCLCYRNGLGTKEDLLEHIEVAKRLFDMNDPNGAELLAIAYYNGIGVPEDNEMALEYYQKAEEFGGDEAKEIAEIHLVGLRNDESWADADEAFKWAKRGVERGNNPDAYAMLYLCYNNGIGTVDNESKAQKMLKEGAEKGSELCQKWLEED